MIGAALLMVFVGACTSSGTQISLVASESSEDSEALGYAFAGEEVTEGAPTITVKAGEEVTITLENLHGQYFDVPAAAHDLALLPATSENRESPPGAPDVADEVLWDVWFGGSGTGLFVDETQTITFVPDAPGTYVYVCAVAGHAARGMVGEFVVESG
ncbi:MAG: multicopper oxidase domain-containing protein [Actinomycetota bacterium]